MTNADLGLADAYIDGDFSFVDKDKGLLNFILVSKCLLIIYLALRLLIEGVSRCPTHVCVAY